MSKTSFAAARLRSGVSILAVALAVTASAARAQETDVGAVNVDVAHQARPAAAAPSNGQPPLSSDEAIGNNAPIGSAPALSVSQAPLSSIEPTSVVSRKIIEDVIPPVGDYNDVAKYTPNFSAANPNGPLGDSTGSWRGFVDGQYNITFDGIPFGDANDPSHHSASYFPPAFIGQVSIDRGPGQASQVGYASFGGTLGMNSLALSDTFGGNVQLSVGNFGTAMESITVQSGYNKEFQTRALFQYEHAFTNGAQDLAHVNQNQFLGKVEKQFGDVTATVFAAFGTEEYNNTNQPTWAQVQQFGKNYAGLNLDPRTQQFVGYNNSQKQTDMEYIDLKGDVFGFHVDNKVYTYSYSYPTWQNNGYDQTIIGQNNPAGTLTKIKIPQPNGTKTTYKVIGVTPGDVTGHLQINDYRGYGDILNISRDISAGMASGQLRFGAWYEHVDNTRNQPWIDYTTGQTYASLGNIPAASTKLDLTSRINNVQPFIEYEWKPTDNLSITPGYKFEAFTRIHEATVNQKTLEPANFSKTYPINLPFLTVRYKFNDQLSAYAQASKGFLAPPVAAYYVFDFNSNNIAPEQTTNYQIGAVYKSGDFTADMDIYQVRATNYPITTTQPDGTTTYQNGGTALHRGFEAEGTYAFGRHIDINGLAATGSFGLSDAKFVQGANTGLVVPLSPRFTAAAGLIYDDATFFGSVMEKVTGVQYGDNGQVASTSSINGTLNRIPTFATTDFVAGYRYKLPGDFVFGKAVEIKVGVQNVFDDRALTDVSGAPGTLTASDPNSSLQYTYLAGRYVYGAIKYSF